jgi:hypothetical protein
LIAPGHDVVRRPGIFDAQRSSHNARQHGPGHRPSQPPNTNFLGLTLSLIRADRKR